MAAAAFLAIRDRVTTMTLDELYSKTAEHLAGAPVKVRWQWPAAEHAMGQTYKAAGGYVIDVAPVSDFGTAFSLYLHELAHCHLRHPASTLDAAQAPVNAKRTDEQRAAWRADKREADANNLAAHWKAFAEKNAWKFPPMTYPAESFLRALLTWQPTIETKIFTLSKGQPK